MIGPGPSHPARHPETIKGKLPRKKNNVSPGKSALLDVRIMNPITSPQFHFKNAHLANCCRSLENNL